MAPWKSWHCCSLSLYYMSSLGCDDGSDDDEPHIDIFRSDIFKMHEKKEVITRKSGFGEGRRSSLPPFPPPLASSP